MFIGLNKDGIKVDVMDAKENEEYFCPVCNGKLRIRDGSVNAKHFAHISLQDCDDFSSDMSEWHRHWQEQFPLKNREVVIDHDGEKHRADVLACGYVIEFQHSPISREEFNRRNEFYTSAGKKVIWIFDLTYDASNRWKLNCYAEWSGNGDNGGKWEWLHSKRCFKDFVPHEHKNIILFFQIADTDFNSEENSCYIERVTWAARDLVSDETSFRHFTTSYYPGTKNELIEWIKNNRFNLFVDNSHIQTSHKSYNVSLKSYDFVRNRNLFQQALFKARDVSLSENIQINDLYQRLLQDGFEVKVAWYGSRLGGMCKDNITVGYYLGNDLSLIEQEDADYLASWFCKNYDDVPCHYEDVVSVFQWWFNKYKFSKSGKDIIQSMIELADKSSTCE